MHRPLEILMEEHRAIEAALDELAMVCARARASGAVDGVAFRHSLEFFRRYADDLHHGQEDALLFPLLELRGMSMSSGPLQVMRYEHEEGRGRLRLMERHLPHAVAGQASAIREVLAQAEAYIFLLRQHIAKEDECLFPMADRLLTDEDARVLQEAFKQLARQKGLAPEAGVC